MVIEGPDGSGKTTQVSLLNQYIKEKGYEAILTREPGGTAIGEAVRGILLDPDNGEMAGSTEMLLYAAARAQLIAEVIGPALEKGKMVLSDRFVDSSVVYQGIARGLGRDVVSRVNQPAIGEYAPDRVIYLDLPEEEGLRRKRRQKKLDRMEQESIAFHHLVCGGYREVFTDRPDVLRIDGMLPIEEIHRIICEEFERILSERHGGF